MIILTIFIVMLMIPAAIKHSLEIHEKYIKYDSNINTDIKEDVYKSGLFKEPSLLLVSITILGSGMTSISFLAIHFYDLVTTVPQMSIFGGKAEVLSDIQANLMLTPITGILLSSLFLIYIDTLNFLEKKGVNSQFLDLIGKRLPQKKNDKHNRIRRPILSLYVFIVGSLTPWITELIRTVQ